MRQSTDFGGNGRKMAAHCEVVTNIANRGVKAGAHAHRPMPDEGGLSRATERRDCQMQGSACYNFCIGQINSVGSEWDWDSDGEADARRNWRDDG